MKLIETIKKVLREEFDKKEILKNYAQTEGLDSAFRMVGGPENYIKIVYNGDVKEFYRNENIEPYRIKEGDTVNMYIDNTLVNHLNLEDFGKNEKKLGDFRYGAKNDMRFLVNVRLIKLEYMNGTTTWKVVGISGSHGFGYSFINKRDVLGKKYRKQIFQQVIDKYNLNEYK